MNSQNFLHIYIFHDFKVFVVLSILFPPAAVFMLKDIGLHLVILFFITTHCHIVSTLVIALGSSMMDSTYPSFNIPITSQVPSKSDISKNTFCVLLLHLSEQLVLSILQTLSTVILSLLDQGNISIFDMPENLRKSS